MRVSLIHSPYIDYTSWLSDGVTPRLSSYIPTGLLSLAAILRDSGHTALLFDTNKFLNDNFVPNIPMRETYARVAESILKDKPDVVGFMTEYYSYHHLLGISQIIKQMNRRCTIVFGGPQASACDLETMESFQVPDIIIRGEGEVTFAELITAIEHNSNISNVAGMTIRSPEGPKRTDPRPLIANLDDLPMPLFDLVDIKSDDLVSIEAGRGCPFACSFCSTSDFWLRRYRMKSPERICGEIIHLRNKYGVKNISLIHDCLTAERSQVLDLCDTMDSKGLGVKWGCSSRTDTIDKQLIERMAASGCGHLYFGLESGSLETQRQINKNLDLEDAFNIIKYARSNGIEVTTPFMVGFPGETRERLANTFEAIYRALIEDVYLVQIFVTAPYGDTPMLGENKEYVHYMGHFLDVLMGVNDLRYRDNLMKNHKGIFSGHYNYHTSGIDDLIVGANQFFPLLNEIRYTALTIWREIGDPLYLYEHWIDWVRKYNATNGRFTATPSYGSFQSFGIFLNDLRSSLVQRIPYLEELIDFERTRLDILNVSMQSRSDCYNPHLSRDFTHSHPKLAQNVVIKTYVYDIPDIIQELRSQQKPHPHLLNGVIAIVGRNEKSLDVLHLNSFAGELLSYCKQGMLIEDMVYRIQRRLQQSKIQIEQDRVKNICENGMLELEKSNLIIVER
ncbi:MAG: B12-binding domain-containing radical SAM protein [Thaumarchaeota archaeon]|nr:B12-binding domain-containing radical SAM protein [Nitrososphaerota archaeon]